MPFYRSLPSIEEILLVRVDRRHVEHLRREGDAWVLRDLIGSAEIGLRLLTEPVPQAAPAAALTSAPPEATTSCAAISRDRGRKRDNTGVRAAT
jgi:hypothetical protein